MVLTFAPRRIKVVVREKRASTDRTTKSDLESQCFANIGWRISVKGHVFSLYFFVTGQIKCSQLRAEFAAGVWVA